MLHEGRLDLVAEDVTSTDYKVYMLVSGPQWRRVVSVKPRTLLQQAL